MQALLLLKQTVEAPYDPGPLLLNGPNVAFTKYDQMLSTRRGRKSCALSVGVDFASTASLSIQFAKGDVVKPYILSNTITTRDGLELRLADSDDSDAIRDSVTEFIKKSPRFPEIIRSLYYAPKNSKTPDISKRQTQLIADLSKYKFQVVRNRFFLHPLPLVDFETTHDITPFLMSEIIPDFDLPVSDSLTDIIHLPGLRGNPERTYKETSVGEKFGGRFEAYTASVIARWQNIDSKAVATLTNHLKLLGLTSVIEARKPSDAEVELLVNRTLETSSVSARELVSIADVGFGVSQVLPVLVALIAANPGQLVYIEQPEIHLHPRAQVILAEIICEASRRGVIAVIETHSALLVRTIQSLVAMKVMDREKAVFHWFARERGETKITSVQPDELGRVGSWPEDFTETELEAESRYLTEVQKRRGKKSGS
jgi:hypothetical protein